MKDQIVKQTIVNSQMTTKDTQGVEHISLFNPDGTPFSGASLGFAPHVTGTAIGTAAKTVSTTEPSANTIVPIRFTNGNNAAAPTVSFNGGTARVIHLAGATPTAPEITVAANGVVLFWFDGTILHQFGVHA